MKRRQQRRASLTFILFELHLTNMSKGLWVMKGPRETTINCLVRNKTAAVHSALTDGGEVPEQVTWSQVTTPCLLRGNSPLQTFLAVHLLRWENAREQISPSFAYRSDKTQLNFFCNTTNLVVRTRKVHQDQNPEFVFDNKIKLNEDKRLGGSSICKQNKPEHTPWRNTSSFNPDRKLHRSKTVDLWDVFILNTTQNLWCKVHNEFKDKNLSSKL